MSTSEVHESRHMHQPFIICVDTTIGSVSHLVDLWNVTSCVKSVTGVSPPFSVLILRVRKNDMSDMSTSGVHESRHTHSVKPQDICAIR
eukprot:4275372-Amphidinium_carterae.1